jgi:hypothetical protein
MNTLNLKNGSKPAGGHLADSPPKNGDSSTPLLATADWTDFRSLDSLPRKGGVSRAKLPALVAKEVVDNALDAAGNASIDLVGPNGFRVADAGPGIGLDDAGIAALFSVRRPRLSSKLWRRPDRGALGNGLRVVAGAVLATGGSVTVSTGGRTLRVTPLDDGTARHETLGPYRGGGTVVEVQLGSRLPLNEAALGWAQEAIGWAGHGAAYKGKPSAHWFSESAFFELCRAQGPDVTVHRFVQNLDGCTGAKAGDVAGAFPKGRAVRDLDRPEAAALLRACRAASSPVPPRRLGSLGRPRDGTPYARVETSLDVGGASIPSVVEVYGSPADSPSAVVLVNRTPVVGEVHAGVQREPGATLAYVLGCGLDVWLAVPRTQRPFRLTVSVLAPAVPLTSEGKAPDLGSAEDEIAGAVAKVLKRVSKAAKAGGGGKAEQQAVICGAIPAAADKASGGGLARFSIRQLFYNVRPAVLLRCGVELNYNYFCKVVTRYENQRGRIPLLYRDPRGVLIHPHTGEQVSLGTLEVESYRRPEWCFNKVLYIEKKGFFPALAEAKFGERHDCALMSSDGYATGAVRDLLDLLDGGGESVTIFCVHDADAYGTGIYQALQNETVTRPGRAFEVVNLGLEPAEAAAMAREGLVEVERVKPTKRRKPVADYVEGPWREWVQGHRVELNAMSTPQFLRWLDAKLAPYSGKVIPPAGVMADRLAAEVEANLRRVITERVLAEAGLDGLVARAVAEKAPMVEAAVGTIVGDVARALEENPQDPWGAPVERIAERVALAEGHADRGR